MRNHCLQVPVPLRKNRKKKRNVMMLLKKGKEEQGIIYFQ